ncbi:pyrroloquinoline-quinone synthase PqqC [Goodfellowiella coeruleoviolacea]|uniref:Pyrroloquinoline-quinone synthase n=1 Tax=Goodfellowiella coeruleoviolacea TaxID=334858 RepID=A0AAE3GAZ8_9PSEU|nr:pyrroloquinoline-quinone synthase PqqC [Goodfellowiella coeruleoviolacea]MCP2164094.1 pyrroloquinoline-quinone synthase [Goodfellowiella coeruleoviolacea]
MSVEPSPDPAPLSTGEFVARLRACGQRYWADHPFHVRLRQGGLSPDELRSWVANRWYYQKNLPVKNAAIIANCPVVAVRRAWLHRIAFQDGTEPNTGGLADWLDLAEAVGLSRAEVLDERHVLPGVRFAVDAYVTFTRTRPWTEGIAAALTELFSPTLMRDRVAAFREHYPWIAPAGYTYFESRIAEVGSDAEHTLRLVVEHCRTRARQDAAVAALTFKCDVLWSIVDTIEHATACRGHRAAAAAERPRPLVSAG